MSNHSNHRRGEEKRTEHGPTWENANPGKGCNSTVLKTILSLMESDAGDIVDDILKHVDPTKLPIAVSLAFLAITRSCSTLPSREILRSSIEQHLRSKNEDVYVLLKCCD